MNNLHNAMTMAEVKSAVDELFGGNPANVYVCCSRHQYFPGKMGIENISVAPPLQSDCPHCWTAYLLVTFAKMPPHIREQRLQEFESAAHHAVESEKRGEFDFVPFRHPEIKIEREQ